MEIEHKLRLLKGLVASGHTAREAEAMIEAKELMQPTLDLIISTTPIRIWLPTKEIPCWEAMSEKEKSKILYSFGFDTRRQRPMVDIIEHRYYGRVPQVTEIVFGTERVDKAWLTKVIKGLNLASLEARFHKDSELLHTMRSNKKS